MKNKFGFTSEQINDWQDEAYLLPGQKTTGLVLLHGWSAMPRQMRTLAENLNELGYWISVPRLAGHGRKPEDLEEVTAKDWQVDVQKAILDIKSKKEIKKIILIGVSMGGSLAVLAFDKIKFDGLILLGTPVHLKNHFLVWFLSQILTPLGKYSKKSFPKSVYSTGKKTSYQYYPIKSVREVLKIFKRAVFSLRKITIPTLILQSSNDYMVAKYSPWVIFNMLGTKKKYLHWIRTGNENHNLVTQDMSLFLPIIKRFIKEIE